MGHDVVAVDASSTLLAAARAADPHSRYLVAAAESLPFKESRFDLVVAYNSLDVDDMPKSVKEAARVLRPGGRFCICITHPLNDAGGFEDESPQAVFKVEGSYFGRGDSKNTSSGMDSKSLFVAGCTHCPRTRLHSSTLTL
jgi:ubiquinone/menaquinone biosynthesis C-methylase UbiE